MPVLQWDQVGSRVYESGLDRGVLYLPGGAAVPWNGLTSVIESFDKEVNSIYYDGMKINELVSVGSFSATMTAVTYPDEFVELEGVAKAKSGVFYADQNPQTFGLCYRVQVGNDIEGDAAGYKIHILYNVIAVPQDKTYASMNEDPSLVEFEWNITAIPQEVPGYRPTAHIIIDSRDVDELLLAYLEEVLYGSSVSDASLIPMDELTDYISNFFRYEIIDHGDGTWTAEARPEAAHMMFVDSEKYFEIAFINAAYLNDYTYEVESTTGREDVPQIKIHDSGNGIWTAHSDYDALIVEIEPGLVEILNATVFILDEDTYQITDTPDE